MNIFQIVKAVGADDLTSPTIPFNGPVGPTGPTPTGVSGPSITLQTTVVALKKGEQTKIEVVIFTDQKNIKSFKFKIKFNGTILKVKDENANVTGTQIAYSDTFFDQKANSVSDQGEIIFEAAAQGVGSITSRVKAYFNVEALSNGVSQIELVKDDSALIDEFGKNILNYVNGVVINVSEERITVTSSPTTTPNISPSTSTIPPTGFFDDIGYTNAVIIGTLLIISGIYLFRKKDSDDLR